MKVIIAGGRDYVMTAADKAGLRRLGITQVICGMATGADTEGRLWAASNGIPVKRMPADWKRYGKAAGIVRNTEMAQCADGLVAFWDGASKGTKHMIDTARRNGLKIIVRSYTPTGKVS